MRIYTREVKNQEERSRHIDGLVQERRNSFVKHLPLPCGSVAHLYANGIAHIISPGDNDRYIAEEIFLHMHIKVTYFDLIFILYSS